MLEKILITGGAGFIGSHIADLLISKDYDVAIIDNLSTGKKENMPSGARLYVGDIRTDSERIIEKEKPTYVIHHAAQINVRSSIENPLNDAENNILGSISLFEACRKFKVKKIIFASSGGTVYGNPKKIPVKENTVLQPLSPYAIAKVAIENYLEFYKQNYNLDYTALRYGNVYGPRQNPQGEAGVISVFINNILKEKPLCVWGDGKQTRDFIYVEDIARANLYALTYNGAHNVFNIGTGKETSIKKIIKILQNKINPLKLSYNLDYKETIPRICLDSELAKHELDWTAKTKLEEGIKKTFKWFREQK